MSQSAQFAPYDASYEFLNTTPATTVYNDANTYINTYKVRLGSCFSLRYILMSAPYDRVEFIRKPSRR